MTRLYYSVRHLQCADRKSDTKSKKNIFILVLMMTLASIFVSCGAESTSGEEEPTPVKLSERVGTYEGNTTPGNTPIKIVLAAKNDGSGEGTMTPTVNGMEDTGTTIPKADMDSTESSFTEGEDDNKVTLAFLSATDKDSDITITIKETNPIVATLVKQ